MVSYAQQFRQINYVSNVMYVKELSAV